MTRGRRRSFLGVSVAMAARRMNIEGILARLEQVRPSGRGWIARCPAHEDRIPSLSIRECDRKILLHCFAGCTVDSVCTALNVGVRDLFMEPCPAAEAKPHVLRQVEKQIASLRNTLSPHDRRRAVTVVLADETTLDAAMARSLALAVEGELVQIAFKEGVG